MENYGIKIAKPGINVRNAGYKDLVFHSSFPVLKVKATGSGTFAGNVSMPVTKTVYTHNLGYTPLFDLFIQTYDPTTGVKQSSYRRASITDQLAGGFNYYTAYVDSTTLKLTIDTIISDETLLSYYYYLYYDPIP